MFGFQNILVVACFVSVCVALEDPRNAQLRQYEFQNDGSGPYRFSFETSDGTKRQEEGSLVYPNTDHAAVVVRGSFSYFGPDGIEYKVQYTADENGFHPEGDHIKVPPYVPWPHRDLHDDEEPIRTGERILDAFQKPNNQLGTYPQQQPLLPNLQFPIKQTPSYPTPQLGPLRGNNLPQTIQPVRFNNNNFPATQKPFIQTTYGNSPTTFQTTPRPIAVFESNPPDRPVIPHQVYGNIPVTGENILSTSSAYLPSTPSPKPVAFVPENIEKTKELNNQIFVQSSTPRAVEITVHSNKVEGEINL